MRKKTSVFLAAVLLLTMLFGLSVTAHAAELSAAVVITKEGGAAAVRDTDYTLNTNNVLTLKTNGLTLTCTGDPGKLRSVRTETANEVTKITLKDFNAPDAFFYCTGTAGNTLVLTLEGKSTLKQMKITGQSLRLAGSGSLILSYNSGSPAAVMSPKGTGFDAGGMKVLGAAEVTSVPSEMTENVGWADYSSGDSALRMNADNALCRSVYFGPAPKPDDGSNPPKKTLAEKLVVTQEDGSLAVAGTHYTLDNKNVLTLLADGLTLSCTDTLEELRSVRAGDGITKITLDDFDAPDSYFYCESSAPQTLLLTLTGKSDLKQMKIGGQSLKLAGGGSLLVSYPGSPAHPALWRTEHEGTEFLTDGFTVMGSEEATSDLDVIEMIWAKYAGDALALKTAPDGVVFRSVYFIAAPDVPETGDHTVLWTLCGMAALGLAGTGLTLYRKKLNDLY